uniref:RagB/SusD family nutrient uptake outer membrane protein n=1 Tax=Prevotella sp. TaxID=59823 RepID=UPI004029B1E1
MKNKFLYIALYAAGMLGATSCSDYLETKSPSTVDADFVFSSTATAKAALEGAKAAMHGAYSSHIFGDGLYYAADIAGSDIMRHPEGYAKQPGRHPAEAFYRNGTETGAYALTSYMKEGTDGTYGYLFSVIGKCNAITTAFEQKDNFEEMMSQSEPTELSQLYGEAVAIRATCYRELIKYFGDVQFQSTFGVVAGGLVSRDSIYDVCIEQLKKVEPHMYVLGTCPTYANNVKNYYSRTYVDGLIGRMALEAGGYQTRRNDIKRVDGKGNPLTFEALGTDNQNATYGRRSDWKNLYATAKEYFKKAIDNAGTAVFHETDPRSEDKNGRVYNNPYQYFFQQLHDADATYADESIYEEPFTQGSSGNDPRPYSLGRPSNGGSKIAYPCKNYGQGRFNPAFYYGDFDPKDLRRDVSCTVTGSTGKGTEALIPFTPGSKQSAGGISCNKFDENRQPTVWTQAQRRSGINAPYMRLSEMYLGYAEACAATGDNAEAKTYLTKVRNRAFRTADEANVEGFINKEGSLLKAIIDERGFEFAGEGDRRFTLIRTGLLPEKIKEIKDLTRKMLDGLKTNGSYTFENGNTISAYIYTKSVDAAGMKDANGNTMYGYRLTTQCPEGKENDPVLYPSWRGQKDNWDELGLDYGTKTPKTNLAIKGLFAPVSDEEAEELTKDGYKKVDWGKTLVDNDDEYYKYLFYDYDYVSAPIYLWPFTPNIIATGGFVNGYGFSNK